MDVGEAARDRRVELIVDAAERVFLRVDFPSASMSEIAAEAGVSRPTLYKYFSSIDELALEVEVRALEALRSGVEEALASSLTGIEALESLLRGISSRFEADRAHLRFTGLFDHYYHEGYPSGAMASRYAEYLAKFDRLEAIVERGRTDGSMRGDFEAHNAAYMVGNAFLALMQRLAARGDLVEGEQRIAVSRQLDEFIAMVIRYAAP